MNTVHFDPTVTLGNIISAGVFLFGLWAAGTRAYSLIDRRILVFETTIAQHARLLESHALRMEKQDDMLIRISNDMQRLVGRLETANLLAVTEAAAAAMAVVKAAEVAALNTVSAAAASAVKLKGA